MKGAALAGMLLAAVVLAATAGAQGNRSQGCPPGFDREITLAQGLALPRIVASIEAGVATVEGLTAGFEATDKNGDGLVCVKAPPGSFKANPASAWQYLYIIVDNNASVPS